MAKIVMIKRNNKRLYGINYFEVVADTMDPARAIRGSFCVGPVRGTPFEFKFY